MIREGKKREDSRAQDMLRIISQAPMSKQVRNRFEEFAANGDAEVCINISIIV